MYTRAINSFLGKLWSRRDVRTVTRRLTLQMRQTRTRIEWSECLPDLGAHLSCPPTRQLMALDLCFVIIGLSSPLNDTETDESI